MHEDRAFSLGEQGVCGLSGLCYLAGSHHPQQTAAKARATGRRGAEDPDTAHPPEMTLYLSSRQDPCMAGQARVASCPLGCPPQPSQAPVPPACWSLAFPTLTLMLVSSFISVPNLRTYLDSINPQPTSLLSKYIPRTF